MFSYTNARFSIIMNDYKSWFISQDWDYSMSWLWCLSSSDVGSLSCLGSNNSNRFHIIFTVEWNFDAQILQKLKIYRKQAGTELCQAQLKLASSLFCFRLAQPTELELDWAGLSWDWYFPWGWVKVEIKAQPTELELDWAGLSLAIMFRSIFNMLVKIWNTSSNSRPENIIYWRFNLLLHQRTHCYFVYF